MIWRLALEALRFEFTHLSSSFVGGWGGGGSVLRLSGNPAAKQMSVPLSVSLLFQMTVDQPHQLQI